MTPLTPAACCCSPLPPQSLVAVPGSIRFRASATALKPLRCRLHASCPAQPLHRPDCQLQLLKGKATLAVGRVLLQQTFSVRVVLRHYFIQTGQVQNNE